MGWFVKHVKCRTMAIKKERTKMATRRVQYMIPIGTEMTPRDRKDGTKLKSVKFRGWSKNGENAIVERESGLLDTIKFDSFRSSFNLNEFVTTPEPETPADVNSLELARKVADHETRMRALEDFVKRHGVTIADNHVRA